MEIKPKKKTEFFFKLNTLLYTYRKICITYSNTVRVKTIHDKLN